jgi:lipopolysaccharide export system permease protein
VWILSGDDLVRAGQVTGSGASFHAENVVLYDRGGGILQRVLRAERADPVAGGRWLLSGVSVYDANMNIVR